MTRRQLAEQFAIAARLYADSVALLTRDNGMMPSDKDNGMMPSDKYHRLRKAAEEAQRRAELAGKSFEEHVDSHRCSG
jgi:hypothetical protein